jgi:hypothetical protein
MLQIVYCSSNNLYLLHKIRSCNFIQFAIILYHFQYKQIYNSWRNNGINEHGQTIGRTGLYGETYKKLK